MDEFSGSEGLDLGSVDDSLGDIDGIDSFDSVDSSIDDIESSDTENIEDIDDMDDVSEIPEDLEEIDPDEDIEDLELPEDMDPEDIEIVEEPQDIENLEIDNTEMTGDELENSLEQEQFDEDLNELLGDMSTDEIDVTDVEEEPLEDVEEADQDIEESEELDNQEDSTEDEEVPEEEPLEDVEEADQDLEESDELDDPEDITEDEEISEEELLEDTEEADQDIEEAEDLDNQEDITEDEEISEEEPLEDVEEADQDIEESEELDDQEDITEDEEISEEEPLEDTEEADQDIEESEEFDDQEDISKDKEVNRPSWELSPEEKEDILSKQDEVSKTYREEHGLDEQGRSLEGNDEDNTSEDTGERTHGEDGERTRYSDLQAELRGNYEVNTDSMESSTGNSWELTPEEKELVLSNQAEVSETYRNRHNLDEHGDKIDNLKDDLDELVDDRDLQRLKDEVDYLDSNTSEMFENNEEESMSLDYSQEELQDIWDNDPGYVNEKAYRNLDEIEAGYKETGNHSEGLLNYGDDAVENTEKETMLPEGKILERYGSEQGRYLTDPGTQYEDLHLIVSEDKLPSHTYEVIKPFRVTESEIADQPFDDEIKENKESRAMQYKSSICVEDLIELGFLKRLDNE